MRTTIALVAVGLSLTTGCFGAGALKQMSSGYVGCSSAEIEISNDEVGFNQRSWDATCRGRTYHCAGADRTSMSCTEDRATAGAKGVTDQGRGKE